MTGLTCLAGNDDPEDPRWVLQGLVVAAGGSEEGGRPLEGNDEQSHLTPAPRLINFRWHLSTWIEPRTALSFSSSVLLSAEVIFITLSSLEAAAVIPTVKIEDYSISPEDYNNAADWVKSYRRRGRRELSQRTLTSPNKDQHSAGYHLDADVEATLAPRLAASAKSVERRNFQRPTHAALHDSIRHAVVSAYTASPEGTAKGVIHNIPDTDDADTITCSLDNNRNPTILQARRLGTSRSVIIAFEVRLLSTLEPKLRHLWAGPQDRRRNTQAATGDAPGILGNQRDHFASFPRLTGPTASQGTQNRSRSKRRSTNKGCLGLLGRSPTPKSTGRHTPTQPHSRTAAKPVYHSPLQHLSRSPAEPLRSPASGTTSSGAPSKVSWAAAASHSAQHIHKADSVQQELAKLRQMIELLAEENAQLRTQLAGQAAGQLQSQENMDTTTTLPSGSGLHTPSEMARSQLPRDLPIPADSETETVSIQPSKCRKRVDAKPKDTQSAIEQVMNSKLEQLEEKTERAMNDHLEEFKGIITNLTDTIAKEFSPMKARISVLENTQSQPVFGGGGPIKHKHASHH
ncbi:hypothetical protein HPB48_003582 [Haemaphysalis longicornis]|uniref:Uncharacterized protein n=1 Tax=Haemaphysalis longicornis TaxID=44386 RepID=A0A9J6FDN8_HAELO|nr:hypothetical protein HPB48_003582 [Haemaphysalis longicornis]